PLPFAMRIDVGEMLPRDADAVAPLDTVAIRDGAAQALAPVAPGEGVLPVGADAAREATLLSSGRRLGGIEIAVLAAAGGGGGRRLGLGRAGAGRDAVIDAAIACIGDSISSEGGVATVAAYENLAGAFADSDADAVVVVGGTGSGRRDASVRTLAALGEVIVH